MTSGVVTRHSSERRWVRFGGIMMAILGAFGIVEGISAIAYPTYFVSVNGAMWAIDLTGWGLLHLILGIVVLIVGIALLGKAVPRIARIAAVLVIGVSMVVQLAWLPSTPLWSLVMIALDVMVLLALISPWRNPVPEPVVPVAPHEKPLP